MYAPGTKARRVLEAVPLDRPITFMDLYVALGLPEKSPRPMLNYLVKQGAVVPMGRNLYQRSLHNNGLIADSQSTSSS